MNNTTPRLYTVSFDSGPAIKTNAYDAYDALIQAGTEFQSKNPDIEDFKIVKVEATATEKTKSIIDNLLNGIKFEDKKDKK